MLSKSHIKYILAPMSLCAIYLIGQEFSIFVKGNETIFIAILISCFTIEYFLDKAKRGEQIYLRPIAGLKAIEEAIGRATEMGKPVLFVPGISDLSKIDTLAGLIMLGHVSSMTSRYECGLHVPVCSPIVMETARETCKESYLKSGRPDLFNDDMVHYIADDQFAYTAGVNGIMLREKPAACFYLGKFYAESLILAETGNSIGAIQIAGTGSSEQIPFFVTACDYTLIGEEFFAAGAYLSKDPQMVGTIKGQDITKLFGLVLLGFVAITFILNTFIYIMKPEWNFTEEEYNFGQGGEKLWSNIDVDVKNEFLINTFLSKYDSDTLFKKNFLKTCLLPPMINKDDLDDLGIVLINLTQHKYESFSSLSEIRDYLGPDNELIVTNSFVTKGVDDLLDLLNDFMVDSLGIEDDSAKYDKFKLMLILIEDFGFNDWYMYDLSERSKLIDQNNYFKNLSIKEKIKLVNIYIAKQSMHDVVQAFGHEDWMILSESEKNSELEKWGGDNTVNLDPNVVFKLNVK